MKLTKEEALKKIEELKKYVENEDKKKVKFEIKTTGGSVLFTSETATNQREAILEAVDSGADLSGADLRGADLSGADLSGAYLSGAYLNDANLRDANLRDANLRDAELNCAKFYGKGGTKPLKRSQLPDFLRALGFVIED